MLNEYFFSFFNVPSSLPSLHLSYAPKFVVIVNSVVYPNDATPITIQTYGTEEEVQLCSYIQRVYLAPANTITAHTR